MTAPESLLAGRDWDRLPERGSARLVRLMVWISLRLGWHLAYALLFPITLYFYLYSWGARRNSLDFLSRALARPARGRDVFLQYFAFAAVILDRVYLLASRSAQYDVRLVGVEHLTAGLAAGRGCLMLGAHVGSFEILRAVAPRERLTIKALMHRPAVNPLTSVLERIDPALRHDIIEIGAVDALLRVREALAGGAIVGVLADRAPEGLRRRPGKHIAVDFFGAPAAFPTGPLLMAAALEVPVVLFFGVWLGPRRYEVRFEPFAQKIVLDGDRRAGLRLWIGRYADRLAACCRAHPYNWFNLYNFWGQVADEADGRTPAAARDGTRDRGRAAMDPAGADAGPGRRAAEPCDLPGGAQPCPADHAGA